MRITDAQAHIWQAEQRRMRSFWAQPEATGRFAVMGRLDLELEWIMGRGSCEWIGWG